SLPSYSNNYARNAPRRLFPLPAPPRRSGPRLLPPPLRSLLLRLKPQKPGWNLSKLFLPSNSMKFSTIYFPRPTNPKFLPSSPNRSFRVRLLPSQNSNQNLNLNLRSNQNPSSNLNQRHSRSSSSNYLHHRRRLPQNHRRPR